MNIGSLAKVLMKKTVDLAGDGAKDVTIILITGTSYDIETGAPLSTEAQTPLGRALFGSSSEAENKKYALEVTTHKAVIPHLHWAATGARYPEAEDQVLIGEDRWEIEKVMTDSMDASITIYMARK